MKELIVIESRVIGAEETNSVNARDLHSFIESKQKFGDWIKNRIEKYGFVESEDFILLHRVMKQTSGSGGHNRTDYILTLDMAKELSMVENTLKGREVRKYFIQIEKSYKQQLLSQTQNFSPVLLESIVTEQQAQRDGLEIVIKMLHQNEQRAIKLHNAKVDGYKKTLTADQIDKINSSIAMAARPVAKQKNISISNAKRVLYATLNNAMSAKSYHHILSHQFLEALTFIRVAGNKAEAELKDINKMIDNEIKNLDDEFYDEEDE